MIQNTWGISLSSVTFLRVCAWSSPPFFLISIITINIIFFRVLLLSSLLDCSTQLSFTGMNDAKTAIFNGHSIITSYNNFYSTSFSAECQNIIECTLKEFELCPGEKIPEKDCWWVTDVSTSYALVIFKFLHLTPELNSAPDVEMSVTTNSPSKNSFHPDDQILPRY